MKKVLTIVSSIIEENSKNQHVQKRLCSGRWHLHLKIFQIAKNSPSTKFYNQPKFLLNMLLNFFLICSSRLMRFCAILHSQFSDTFLKYGSRKKFQKNWHTGKKKDTKSLKIISLYSTGTSFKTFFSISLSRLMRFCIVLNLQS